MKLRSMLAVLVIVGGLAAPVAAQSEATIVLPAYSTFDDTATSVFKYEFPDGSVWTLDLRQDYEANCLVRFRNAEGLVFSNDARTYNPKTGTGPITFSAIRQGQIFYMEDSLRFYGFVPVEAQVVDKYLNRNSPLGYGVYDLTFTGTGLYDAALTTKKW